MIELWSIDPGKHKSAVAFFELRRLVQVAHCPVQNVTPLYQASETLVIVEMPRRVHRGKSTDEDIIALARSAERSVLLAEQAGCVVETAAPDDWTSVADKPKRHRNVWLALTPSEQGVIGKFAGRQPYKCWQYIETACHALATGGKVRYGWTTHNVLDAVGIGLWKLGRIDKAGNIR